MSFYIREFPPALHKIFDDKAQTAFIRLIYKIELAKELDYALSRENHLKALDDLIARRFAVSTAENEPALQEVRARLQEAFTAYKRDKSQRLAGTKIVNKSGASPALRDKWFAEIIAWLDECFDEFEARLDELHAILMKYIFIAMLILLSQDFRLDGLNEGERRARIAEPVRRLFAFSA